MHNTTDRQVLATGATGFIGGALVPALRACGSQVVAATRRSTGPTIDAAGVEWSSCDLLRPETLPAARRGLVRADLVQLASFAAVYALATMALGSLLLVLDACVCAIAWGSTRLASGSLAAPIVAHVLWNLGAGGLALGDGPMTAAAGQCPPTRGTWSERRDRSHLDKLRSVLGREHLEALGEPVWARYGPPFEPWFLRRNEILLDVRPAGEARDTSP